MRSANVILFSFATLKGLHIKWLEFFSSGLWQVRGLQQF